VACGRSVGDSPTFVFRRVSMLASGPGDILKGPLIVGILNHYPSMLYLSTCRLAADEKSSTFILLKQICALSDSMDAECRSDIATRYGLDGPGIESRWGEIFRTRLDQPWGPPSFLYNGYWVFPGGKAARAWR
jgi:hypothetical protein